MSKLLTIGMATYDDFDGVYFTIQALKMYHPMCDTPDVEFIIIDNNPTGAHHDAIKSLANWNHGQIKLIPFKEKTGTSTRNEIFKNAKGKYTLCMDCHVLVQPNGIDNLLKYYKDNPDTGNLVQGPMLYDDNKQYSTHFRPEWGSGMFGKWSLNKEAMDIGEPFEIPMHGLGLFSCQTDKWLGFNERFKGFGGEEGYIHEKFRQAGNKCICLPGLKWMHRFSRPNGIKYPNIWEDRIWNYFVGWMEIYNDPAHPIFDDIKKEFTGKVPAARITEIFDTAII
jgi:hypothetical protein